jgi:hypothetical protein
MKHKRSNSNSSRSKKNPCVEFVPGDGCIRFNFKLCGELTLGISGARERRHRSVRSRFRSAVRRCRSD